MVNNYQQAVNQEPQISLNKLGEYMTAAKPSRRERILRDAKYPPTFQVIRYDPARWIIQRFLSGKIANTAALHDAIDDYAISAPTNTEFEARMRKSNLEALTRFLEMVPALDFGAAKMTLGAHAPPRRTINGVSVSVRPDLNITMGGGNAPLRRGGIKLNLSQGAVHSKESAEYVGAVLRTYIDEGGGAGDCDHQLCFALDVFGQKVLTSPKAIVNRMKDVEAGCGEIARQWASI